NLDVNVEVDDAAIAGAPDDSAALSISVTDVNEAPTATNLSAAETYTENAALNLADIVVSDVDSANVTVTLTLSNVAAGSLSTGTSGAVTSTFAGGVWSASGAIADVNTLLSGVTFNPALNYNNNFTIATSVDDGVAAPVTGSKAMTATAVNNPPTATNLSAGEAYTEDTPLDLTDIVVSDVDSANVTVTLTLSDPAAGTLSTGTSGAVTSTFAGGVWTASGAIADVNSLLVGVTFNPAANYDSNFTIATSVDDGVAAPVTGTKVMTATSVNDAPTGADNSVSLNEDTTHTFAAAEFGFADVDAGDSLKAVRIETLTLPAGASLQLSGTDVIAGQVILAADISNLVFTPAADANGAGYASFTFSVQDQADAFDAAPNTLTIDVTALNDAPTATNLNAAETYTLNTPTNLTDIVVTDVDGGNVTVTLTLSDVTAGTLSTGTSGAVTSTFAAGVWTASGAIADVNTLLAGVTFNPALNYNSNFTIATRVDDGVAPPMTGTKTVTTNAVPTTTGIANVNVTEDAPATGVNLFTAFNDVEDADPALSYTMTGNTNAVLFSSTPIDGAAGTLTLNYAANANGTADITMRATDTAGAFVESTFTITVAAVNDDPSMNSNVGLSLNEGDSSAVTSSILNVIDIDNPATQISYTLTNIPIGGTLFLNGTPLGVTDSFTQDDINNNRVTYAHGGGAASSDSFSFTVADGAGGSLGPITFSVTVLSIGPPPSGSGGGTVLPPTPPITPGPPPVPDPGPVDTTVPPGGGTSAASVPAGGATASGTRSASVSDYVPLQFPDDTNSADSNDPAATKEQDFVLTHDELKLMESVEVRDLSIEHNALYRSLDEMRLQMRDVAEIDDLQRQIILNVSKGMGLSLTVGYLSWVFSTGSLLASALSSMPMWTKFDPLPILAGGKKRRKRKDTLARRKKKEKNDDEQEIDLLFKKTKPAKGSKED
ncbi:MAG: Ig-like domain-containing protein, partial [Gammaproteobacteria bacterium]|nr:Ig-like domain-containing protein [Gammaproteobacteria bacterium]